jgi:murein L,D-transpeptidase YcbB/YkuD
MRRRHLVALLCLAGAGGAAPAQPSAPQFDAAQARAALALLADAASHGLDPLDYAVPALRRALDAAPLPDPRTGQALAQAMQQFLVDLHDGRLGAAQRPRHGATLQRPPFDAAGVLRAALALQDLPQAVQRAAPALPQYARLRDALARYRALADHAAWQQPLPALPRASGRAAPALDPGQAWPGLPLLSARLQALGDAPADLPPADLYDAARVAAVEAFQRRHGLLADGVLGRATWAALQVPPEARVRQLELALERLRWTPLLTGSRMIVVNIPEFVLRAYEVRGERIVRVAAEMKVIVGKSLDTRTPLIHEDLRRIEFQPFWNVPASIARKELVPRLQRDPGHWQREGFEFVGRDGAADPVLDEAKLQAVLAGQLRIRQRPGPRNALGDIKFVFPNRDAIYLHHTPAVGLFERPRRDFSHGCIRVEQPVALAAFALQGLPGWDDARIRAAMSPETLPSTVALAQPVPVVIAYGTALVKENKVHFFDDLYGHDRALDAALRQRARPVIDLPPT